MLPVKTKTPLVMRIGLHDEGLVLLTPEIPGEPSEAVRRERGGNGFKRIRGFAHSGDSFRRSRFRRASGGPIFSVLPEKMGGEKGRWGTFGAYCGCGSGRNLIFSCCEHTKPPYVRYGTRRLLWYTDFSSSCDSISAAKSLAFETCRVVRDSPQFFLVPYWRGSTPVFPWGKLAAERSGAD